MIATGIDKRRINDPTAHSWRWGFCRGAIAPAALAAWVLSLFLTGCAGSSPEADLARSIRAIPPARIPWVWRNSWPWIKRGRPGASWPSLAGKIAQDLHETDRMQDLVKAAGLTPDDPEIWLRLAKVWRWVGDNIRTENCLEQCRGRDQTPGPPGCRR